MWLSRRLAGRYVLLSAVLRAPLVQIRKERVQVPDHTPGSLVCLCVRVCVAHAWNRSHCRHTRSPHAPHSRARVWRTNGAATQPDRAPAPRRPLLAAGSCPAPRTASRPPVHAAARPSVGAHSLPASSSRSGGSSGSSLTSRSSQPMVQLSPPAAAAARGLGVRQGPRRRRRRRAPASLAHEAVTHPGPARPRASGAPPRALGGRAVGRPFALCPTHGWRGWGCEREWRLGPRTSRLRGFLVACLFPAAEVSVQSHPVTHPRETFPARPGVRVITCIK